MSAVIESPRVSAAPMSVFERYLTVWVFLCIVVGYCAGQLFPAAFQAVGRLEVAQGQHPGGRADLGDDHPYAAARRLRSARQVKNHWRGIGDDVVHQLGGEAVLHGLPRVVLCAPGCSPAHCPPTSSTAT
jgi:hypothetical protein